MCTITSTDLLRDTQGEEDEDHRHQEHDRSSLVMSLQDVVDPPPPPPPSPPPSQQPSDNISDPLIDDISIPISAQLFDFCDSDIFPDTLQNSEVTSSPNCCSYEDQNSSYATNISFPSSIADDNDTKNSKFSTENSLDINNFQGDPNDQNGNTSTTSSTATTATTINAPGQQQHDNSLSVICYDPQVEIDNDISASIDFSPSPPFSTSTIPYNLNLTHLTYHVAISNGLTQYPTNPVDPTVSLPLPGGHSLALGPVFEDDCLSSVPPFLRLNPSAAAAAAAAAISSSSCTFLDPPTIANFRPANLTAGLCADNSGMFGGNLLLSGEFQANDLDFQGDNASIFCPDQLPRYNSGDIQAFSNENSQLVNGSTSSAPIATEISSLDDSTYKVAGKLSVEQRKEKIHRYQKKRHERNFSKKIKYACRKTLADSRPRVRGRFAKNDEFGEGHKHMNGNHEEDDYDEVVVKDEDDMADSSDIFAHISGVNSFKCNYQIQSWI